MSSIDYSKSGVNIDEGNRFVSLIKSMVDSTKVPGVIGGIGGFAGFFSLKDFKHYEEPVLVSATDGVGTKLKVAFMAEKFDTVGIDLVAMCVNDLVVTGAKPLFFLDYIATGKLSADKMVDVVKGITDGCKMAGSALVGGETAEMPGMYSEGEFDLAGFAVGILDKAKTVDGSGVEAGDVLIGLSSSGYHSNGYSLLRKIYFDELGLSVHDELLGTTVGELLLTPTKIYVPTINRLMEAGAPVKAMVHVTGGGFYENIPRVLPDGVSVTVDPASFPKVKAYEIFDKTITIDPRELYRVFNMGIGYILVCRKEHADDIIRIAESCGESASIIGTLKKGAKTVSISGIDA